MAKQPEPDSFIMTAGKIAVASAISFVVWKVLQATIGVHMDRAIEARVGRKVT